jgi:flagellar biosynthesis chaperone FliJ
MKKRKALEKLKEIGKEEYINNLNLSLNKEMDDIAMTRFNNKQRA